MDLRPLAAQLSDLRRNVDVLFGRYEQAAAHLTACERAKAEAGAEAEVLTLTAGALQELLAVVSREGVAQVEALLSYGLSSVFDDQSLSFKLDISTKRGVQSMEPRLVQGDVEGPVLESFGGGPGSVVAFLLRVMAARRLGLAPVLLLDESFAQVSAGYVPGVASLLKELCDKTGLTILLVTHQPEFIEHADKAYEAFEEEGATAFRSVS